MIKKKKKKKKKRKKEIAIKKIMTRFYVKIK